MTACDLIRRLHEHRIWANRRLIDAAQELDPEQLHQPYEIGQGAVRKTLKHLVAAEWIWLAALEGDHDPTMPGDVPGHIPGNQKAEGAIRSLEELVARWLELAQRWEQYLSSLKDDALDEIVYKMSTSSGAGRRHRALRRDVLLHVCTHAQYTSAQLVNMLRQLGEASLPDIMLISMARAEASRAT